LNTSFHSYLNSDIVEKSDVVQFVVPILGLGTVIPYSLIVPVLGVLLFSPCVLKLPDKLTRVFSTTGLGTHWHFPLAGFLAWEFFIS
jgi:hypothetical protein